MSGDRRRTNFERSGSGTDDSFVLPTKTCLVLSSNGRKGSSRSLVRWHSESGCTGSTTAVARRFLQVAKRNWRRGRISDYLAAVVVRVAAVIAIAGGFKAAETKGQAAASEKVLVALLYAIAATALTAAEARQKQRWYSGARVVAVAAVSIKLRAAVTAVETEPKL